MENPIDYHEYLLRNSISLAKLDNAHSDSELINMEGKWWVSFLDFKERVRNISRENPHWKADELDIKKNFLPMIESYLEWYSNGNNERIRLDETYRYLNEILISTKEAILKYLPENLELLTINKEQTQKLKWLGKPEQFGFIFSELAAKGYIELPSTNGEGSYAKYAKICSELFDFAKKTTSDNLERALNPNKNQLADANRSKISIPEMKDIS